MPSLNPSELSKHLDGVMSFPVTPFAVDGSLNLDVFAEHLSQQVAVGPAALFVCCGTGEFFSLEPDEFTSAVRTAVRVADGALPVVAGIGYGTALAKQLARSAAEEGADGLLVLPPYLIRASQEGLLAYYRAIAESTPLGVIVYQRDNVTLTASTVAALGEIPNVVGVKDGQGDLDLLQRFVSVTRATASLVFLNGLPTAEMTALAYWGQGVTAYSSAVLCFAPEIAMAFHRALCEHDTATVARLLDEFYGPLVELRGKGDGYAVSLVKAGVRMRGLDVGPVRAPLTEPTTEHVIELEQLVRHGLTLVGASW